MKFVFLFFLLLPIAGQTYVAWRTWQLLPDIMPLRMAVVGLMARSHDRVNNGIFCNQYKNRARKIWRVHNYWLTL